MDLQTFIQQVRGTLIVSAQAPTGHVLRDTRTIAFLARAAEAGGSTAIRCGGYGGLEDIKAVVEAVQVPVIGLTKEGDTGVYITPSVASAVAVAQAGAAVVAIDATARPRQDGSDFAAQVRAVHEHNALAMADIATAEEAVAAHQAGADVISTTLAGYTEHRAKTEGPDLELIREIRQLLGKDVFLIGEGRFHTPQQAALGIEAGADAIIVGTAITDVAFVTAQFANSVSQAASK
ncbi:N-acetylmannosamine-6-phosphate 2-epimerase [Corynebacterium sp. 153RC1]|uniref:N-acetylmannosamine-6-phosphate 2-epimerase n=1 Tax=Corynebacterium TaxID=1716 RepID=UPI00211CF73D|nr:MULTISPECIES: N-acetylmannosamine-6-phosphate 2-epimerase [unclassified Corynebacterium]MCQ9370504.1 N-acetylmannosamine-6-phosphate 2-epimerase [Corynebacterium sp. 35RC1]MCQ9342650.1 N-acetylmannosamine-6-phosphate 2-epimerase [Corynebacterium sp. 76QC2CO]MCQ9351797.1 N-acetylmannosamine-6-phosphate 2-epimerase [Corynebacterium sp. 209RC1]MCQ9354533.1 N-acetylmannosamine-6-phosphate 2-epimerase [Corynebacterium sp. 1222RC1]MCQ9356079.1 N-acetylmannosamine-6-phosphate 2-epimerase [Coryneba